MTRRQTTPPPALEYSRDFLRQLDASAHTLTTYAQGLRALAEHLGGRPGQLVLLDGMGESALVDFRASMRRRGYGARTEATYMAAAVRFLRWLSLRRLTPEGLDVGRARELLEDTRGRRRKGYAAKAPKAHVPLILEHLEGLELPPLFQSISNDRRRLMILRNRALAVFLLTSGARASEVVGLKRGQLPKSEPWEVRITGKGQKDRVLSLGRQAVEKARRYLEERDAFSSERVPAWPGPRERDPLFVRHDREGAGALTTAMAWAVLAKAARAAGLPKVSPHDFRRWVGTDLLRRGMPLTSVQEFLGHSSIETTRKVYAQTLPETLREHVATFRPSPDEAMADAHKASGEAP